MYKTYYVPNNEDNYLKGIIRNSKVRIKATSSHYQYPKNETAIIENNYFYYWHSEYDEKFGQYVQIDFLNAFVDVSDYMYSTGSNVNSNGVFSITKTWNVLCSSHEEDWTLIDSHKNDPSVTTYRQKLIFKTKNRKKCKSFRFCVTGKDNIDRYYGYFGPIEFYGKVYRTDAFTYISMSASIQTILISIFIAITYS